MEFDILEQTSFEPCQFLFRQCVGFGNNRYDVDFPVQPLHELNI